MFPFKSISAPSDFIEALRAELSLGSPRLFVFVDTGDAVK